MKTKPIQLHKTFYQTTLKLHNFQMHSGNSLVKCNEGKLKWQGDGFN